MKKRWMGLLVALGCACPALFSGVLAAGVATGDETAAQKGLSPVVIALIVAGVVIVAGIVFAVIKKKKGDQ